MCGIVGLFIKDPTLEPELGRLTAGMLATLSDRGPDSAGFAVYGQGKSGETKLTLRAPSAAAMQEIADKIGRDFSDASITLHDTHAVVCLEDRSLPRLSEWLAQEAPEIEIVGTRPPHGDLQGGRPPRESLRALRACLHAAARTPSAIPAWRRNRP